MQETSTPARVSVDADAASGAAPQQRKSPTPAQNLMMTVIVLLIGAAVIGSLWALDKFVN